MSDTALNKMKNFTFPRETLWLGTTRPTDYPALKEDIHVDVAVIGAGIAGITTAFLLEKESFRTVVIDAGKIAAATSAHTTAKITSQHGLIYDKIKNSISEDYARLYADANENAVHFMADLIKEKNIDCGFQWKPAYVYTEKEENIKKIEDEVITAASLGIKTSFEDKLPLPFEVKAAVKFENQAQFHPRKYLLALAEEFSFNGGLIFENTRAVNLEEGNPHVIITEKGNKIYAKYVIIASHYPFYDGLGMYFTRMHAEKSYIIAAKIKEKFPEGMFVTVEDPSRSMRCQEYKGGEVVLFAGEKHKTGHGENLLKHYENLESFAKDTFTLESILYQWSTQDYTTLDDIPYAGNLTSGTKNIYVASGFRKWGMTNATSSSLLIKDLILKGKSPWEEVYNPSRTNIAASAPAFIARNTDTAVTLISGKLAPAQQEASLDTTCSHMGCELKWNDAEKSWDCPCHGSRFDEEGKVIEGPAIKNLEKC